MLSLVMVAALALADSPPAERSTIVTGRITVKYREFRLGDAPPIKAPSFSIVDQDDRVSSLLIKSEHKDTLKRLADTGGFCTVIGTMHPVNGRPFILVESIKEYPR